MTIDRASVEENLRRAEGKAFPWSNNFCLEIGRDWLRLRKQISELERWGDQVHAALDGRELPEHADEAPARIQRLRRVEQTLREIGQFAASHERSDPQPILLNAIYRIAEEADAALANPAAGESE